MTVPVLSQEDFLNLLKNGGCKIIADEYWNEQDTLVLQKGEIVFTLKLEPKYFYPMVVVKCLSVGITPPKDHLRSFYQHLPPDTPCYCESETPLPFWECHGKNEEEDEKEKVKSTK